MTKIQASIQKLALELGTHEKIVSEAINKLKEDKILSYEKDGDLLTIFLDPSYELKQFLKQQCNSNVFTLEVSSDAKRMRSRKKSNKTTAWNIGQNGSFRIPLDYVGENE